jgi:hypothetical protein
MQVGSKAKLAMKEAIKDMQAAIVRKEVYDSRRRQELLQQGLSLEEVCALLLLYYCFTTALLLLKAPARVAPAGPLA